jgi:hypothetical protein
MGGDIVNPFASLASAIQQPQPDQQPPQAQEQGPSELMNQMGQANLQPPQPVSNVQNLVQGIGGRSGQRLQHFEQFLSNFVQGMSAGLGAAQGPNAFGRGLAVAATAPYANAVQRWQLGNQAQMQQAQLQGMQSENQLRAAQGQSLGSETQQRNLQTAMLARRLQAMSNPNAQPGDVTFQNMTTDERVVMNNAYRQFQLTGDPKVVNDAFEKIYTQRAQGDRTGLSDVVPDQGSPTGFSRALYNKNGDVIRLQPGILPQAGWAQHTTTTYQWKEDKDGIFRPLPVTSTTRPGLPGVQAKVPALGAASPQQQLQKKVPALGGGMEGPKAGESGIAFDPTKQEYTYTTRSEAAKNGLVQFMPSTTHQFEEDRQLNNRLSDVAMKLSRYQAAFQQPISTADVGKLSAILSDDKLKLGMNGISLPVDWANKLLKAGAQAGLSSQGQKLLLSYANARESLVGYQRVLSGSGRSSDKSLELQLDTLPTPLNASDYANEALRQFNENLTVAAQGLPRIPGIKTVRDFMQGGSADSSSNSNTGWFGQFGGKPR